MWARQFNTGLQLLLKQNTYFRQCNFKCFGFGPTSIFRCRKQIHGSIYLKVVNVFWFVKLPCKSNVWSLHISLHFLKKPTIKLNGNVQSDAAWCFTAVVAFGNQTSSIKSTHWNLLTAEGSLIVCVLVPSRDPWQTHQVLHSQVPSSLEPGACPKAYPQASALGQSPSPAMYHQFETF